jgi:hypothetical protein
MPIGLALVCGVWALPYALTIMLQLNGIPLLPVALLATYAWLVTQAARLEPASPRTIGLRGAARLEPIIRRRDLRRSARPPTAP